MSATAECPPPAPVTILIVDDHDAMRASLSGWISTIFPDSRCLAASSGEDAVALTADQLPELVLMDIGLPGINGIEAIRRIKTAAPRTQVVVLSIHEAAHYRADAAAAGASAYVTKRRMHTELIPVLTQQLSTLLSPQSRQDAQAARPSP